jgi:hypothetical protein
MENRRTTMPDAKDNAKATGDTHLPELEETRAGNATGRPNAEGADGPPPDSSLSRDVENEGRAGKGINQAGYLKDKDAPGAGGEDKGQR